MKKIKKIIIPAAGWGTRFLPLTKVVHKELVPVLNKPIIQHLAEEAVAAGVEEIILIISPRKLEISKYFTINSQLEHELRKKGKVELLHKVQATNDLLKISIAIQNEQLGLGHAIFMAADQIDNEPFGIILGDDLIKSKIPAIKQLIDVYNKTGSSVIGVQTISDSQIHKYGVVIPKNPSEKNDQLFEISGAVEKPDLEHVPSNKAILGRYVFTPQIMHLLRDLNPGVGNEINIVDAFDGFLKNEKIYALDFEGQRYDLGSVDGFVKAQIDYALDSDDIKDSIMEHISKK
ncbi:UTP--glucose-1-phosphate uridylyltransferase [Candidatus Mycoplasma mahonii]|uniref:UTP--glucose-1-phosphate uridylyltransferase n=1 Tax=Candidatus Mycoplasma mahonii TaxID=3004105 RepID=UPI0026F2FBD9|nr:UTP--glucose-1-phosphate uridylyltransferase [Candidatus Mycoplasma mahonii]WKX02192.1 UTP--glucose-1-phosphate uridylyltransferase [Candidatus Mycoplasma mahonii]